MEAKLQGGTEGPVSFFKGVPFAAPPTGELRWRAPQPLVAWKGVRQAVSYSGDCMQEPFPSDAAPLGTTPSEDCLYLNVWRPAGVAAGAKLPVMFWIYGGGFVNGGSSPAVYDGSKLAAQGVLLVSANYRVGRFGFFGFPELTRQNADGLLGNYGFMDQIAALRWVQTNIAAFGGDPQNVTVFGESAGGFSRPYAADLSPRPGSLREGDRRVWWRPHKPWRPPVSEHRRAERGRPPPSPWE